MTIDPEVRDPNSPRLPEENRYLEDGRLPWEKLNEQFEELEKHGWQKELIYTQKETIEGHRVVVPVYAYTSPSIESGSDWLYLTGEIHGEEPAGPNALARNLPFLMDLSKQIPMVIIPFLNPVGYHTDWRYFGEKRDWRSFLTSSVTDAIHLVGRVGLTGEQLLPTAKRPVNKYAQQFYEWLLKHIDDHQPLLFIDFHEDELASSPGEPSSYLYIYGEEELCKKIGTMITGILKSFGFPMYPKRKRTRFGEELQEDGLVINTPGNSIDDLFAADCYYDWKKRQWTTKNPAEIVVVVETSRSEDYPLEKRVKAQGEIIKQIEPIWTMVRAAK